MYLLHLCECVTVAVWVTWEQCHTLRIFSSQVHLPSCTLQNIHMCSCDAALYTHQQNTQNFTKQQLAITSRKPSTAVSKTRSICYDRGHGTKGTRAGACCRQLVCNLTLFNLKLKSCSVTVRLTTARNKCSALHPTRFQPSLTLGVTRHNVTNCSSHLSPRSESNTNPARGFPQALKSSGLLFCCRCIKLTTGQCCGCFTFVLS